MEHLHKIKDRVILGMVAGFLGDVPKLLASEALYLSGVQKGKFAETISGMFLTPGTARKKNALRFGTVADAVLSSALGVLLVYLLSSTGKDYALIKGGGTGLVAFEALRGLLANIGPGRTSPRDVTTNFLMSSTSLLWGVVAAAVATSVGDETIFRHSDASASYAPDDAGVASGTSLSR